MGKTVKQGFEQLVMWVDGRHIQPQEWVAVYYDNPDDVPAEKLRCVTAVTVVDDFTIPENSEGVMMTEIAAGGMLLPPRALKIMISLLHGISSSTPAGRQQIPDCSKTLLRTLSERWQC